MGRQYHLFNTFTTNIFPYTPILYNLIAKEKTMRNLSIIIMLLLLAIFTTCEKTGSDSLNNVTIDPFSNGSSERNMIVVLSDMHMGADITYTQCNNNIAPSKKMLQRPSISKC